MTQNISKRTNLSWRCHNSPSALLSKRRIVGHLGTSGIPWSNMLLQPPMR
jgi:hypothetical protein